MRTPLALATGCLVVGLAVVFSPASHAQNPGPNNYPYCGMSQGGGTTCYFNSLEDCRTDSLSCIENPGYVGPAYGSQHFGRFSPPRD